MKFYLGLNIKDEIETKDEPLDFDEEEMENGQVFDQTSGLDESQKRKSGCYSSLDDIKNDLILMFQNACQYNEPESQIYRDALTLQRLVMQKTLELYRQDELVPNVLGLVQEMLMSLFISVYNHEIFEGRYTVESFSDLPEYEEEIDGQRTKALNFAIMKRRLDKGLYTRLDHFQDELFSIFDRARNISKEDSRIFSDSIILQKEFIKVRDELCGKGSILSSKALGFNERQLNKVLIMQAKIFKRIWKDEKLTEDTSDEITEDEDLKTLVQQQNENADNSNCVSHNQIHYFVGDFVYVIPPEKNCDFPILHIRQLWKNKADEDMCYGCQYFRPAETSDLPTKEFYEQEVFKTEKHMSLPLSEVWPYSLPEGTQITERVKHLVMRKGEFIFKEQIDEQKEKLAELEDETKIINHLPNVLKSTVLDIKGNIYYKQYSSGSVTIKLGDFVYTRNRGIIHVIGIWVTSEEEAFISGT
ncbi:Protein polybromo-1, partial [Armadillidium nasatum]